MNQFEYSCPTNIVFGENRTNEVGSLVLNQGASKVLVVYGGGSVKKNGILDTVETSLKDSGLGYCLFGGVQSNPQMETVAKGIEVFKAEKCDFLLAVGGGSVMDSAKAIALGLGCKDVDELWERLFLNYESLEAKSKIGVIPTIAASGSETGESCVISYKGKKLIGTSASCAPVFALMDPANTLSLPDFQTFCGAADILSHLQERYFVNAGNNDLTDRFLEGAMRLVIQTALMLKKDPKNIELRSQLMWAGTIAHNPLLDRGRNGGDWACHMIEHEISAAFPVTHGEGLSMITPAWLSFVDKKPQCRQRMVQFATRVWGSEFPQDSPLCTSYAIDRQVSWYKELGLKTSLSQVDGFEEKHARQIADSFCWQPGQFASLSCDDIFEILNSSLTLQN